MLKRSPEQEADLRNLIASQQDPSSPQYRHWLTPEEFGKRFGPADSDVQTVAGYLASEGLALGRISKGKSTIEVTGTAGQIRSVFHTEIHRYSVGGQSFYANSSDPKIPAALAPVVAGFAALNNAPTAFPARETPARFDPSTHRATPLYDLPGTSSYGVSPADLSTIYDIPAATSNYGRGGAGINIGFVGDSNINVGIVANYRAIFGLPANNPIVVVDGNDPGVTSDASIAYKQLELAGAVAPNATIYYYTSATTDYDSGLYFAMIRAVDDNTVQVLGIGYQSCETALGTSSMPFVDALWEQAAAQGITVVAAAGNSGAAGCDTPGSSSAATGGLAVNGFASTAFDTAVGGTDFYYGTTHNYSAYWAQGTTTYGSALSYIPEQVWNDSNTGNDATAGTATLLAGGGGLSSAGADGVSTPNPQPSYQVGVVPSSISSTVRVLPDVSFFAGTGPNNTQGYNNTAYLFCMANSDCQSGAGQPQFTLSGGTEAASAVFAGAMALVVEYQNSLHQPPSFGNPGIGNANPSLYYFVKNKVGTWHDVTIGNNMVQCANKNCTNGLTSGYSAASGYDAATGLGSFDITSLVSKWPVPNTTATTTTIAITDPATGAPVTTIQHSQPVNFTMQVSSSAGTPTGDVSVITNNPVADQGAQFALTLSPTTNSSGQKVGQATYTNDNLLPGGTYQLAARYAGDGAFAPSVSSTTTLTVTPESSMIVVYGHNVNYSGSSIPYGSPVQITAEPYSTGATNNVAIGSGSLQVYDGSTLITTLPINSEGAATFSSNLLPVGSHSIVLKYPGDASFLPSQTSPFNFTVTSATTQTTLYPSTTNVGEGGSNADGLTAVVISTTLPSNGSAPAGTVTFSTVPAQVAPLVPGFDPNGNAIATASIQVSPSQVPANGIISATYNPSSGSNYTGSTSPGVQFTQTTSQYNGTTSISFTLTDAKGTYPAQSGLSFPTSDTLSLNINVATDTPNASYVTVYANGTAISPQLWPDSNGNVTFQVPRQNGYLLLPSGQVQLTIQYDGWQEYIFGYPYYQAPPASTNLVINITDNRTSADFSIQSATTVNQQNPLTASSTSVNYALQLTSIYNFQSAYATTPINLSCSIPNNPGLQCSLNPGSVTLGGSGFANATLTVSAASGSTIASAPMTAPDRWWFAGGGTALACVFLLTLPGRRRQWQSMLGVFALLVITFAASGCANTSTHAFSSGANANTITADANSTGGSSSTTVQPGVYTVIVTATTTTNTTIVHNLPIKVLVQ